MSIPTHKYDIQSTTTGEVRLAGRFVPKSTSDPSVWYGNWISSIAHTATGVWTITVKAQYRTTYKLLAVLVSITESTPSGIYVQSGTYDVALGTLVVAAWTQDEYGVPVASDATNTGNSIHVELILKPDIAGVRDGTGI